MLQIFFKERSIVAMQEMQIVEKKIIRKKIEKCGESWFVEKKCRENNIGDDRRKADCLMWFLKRGQLLEEGMLVKTQY